ncbi:uncharacterized protein LOC134812946 isoform X2 [Bolinopsis microptera]
MDMVDELLEYLDGELPKADQSDVESVLDMAAPVLAALLVPMKQKYDRIVEIKEEVTEAITDVVPVEEIVQDYEETLDDLKDFCKHISQEVEVNWQDNLDELHRKLWELDSTMAMSELEDFSLSSFDNTVPAYPARLRRQMSELESDNYKVLESPDLNLRRQVSEYDNYKVLESPDLNLRRQVSEYDNCKVLESPDLRLRRQVSEYEELPFTNCISTRPFVAEMARLTPERFQSPTQSAGTSPTTSNVVVNILPSFEISNLEISPASSRSISPIQGLHSQYSFSSMANNDRAQSPGVFYSACHSRRQSNGTNGSDLISRYVSAKHPQLYHSEQFKDFSSRRSSLNYSQTLYDLSHFEDSHSTSTTDSLNRRHVSRKKSALSFLVEYVKYKIGSEKTSNFPNPVEIENIREEEEVKIKITRSSVSSE